MDLMKENWKEILINFIIMLIIFSIGFSFHYFLIKKDKERSVVEKEKKELILKLEKELRVRKEIEKRKKVQDLNLIAKGILVKELDGEEVYSKNKNKIFPIASVTKVVNALAALERFSGEKVVITKRALDVEGEYGLSLGEVFNQKEAVKYMLIASANDIASAISFGYKNIIKHWTDFMEDMNNFADQNHLDNTLFFSENGLNISGHIMGGYSTAEDVSKFVKIFYQKYPNLASGTSMIVAKICSNKKCHFIKNTNVLLEKYPEIIFSKTGFTKKSGGSLVTILKIKNKKYIVILLKSTKQGRFEDLEKIIKVLREL